MTEKPRNNGTKTGKPSPPVEHQFKPGNPGRPKGSRNKLGEDFIKAMQEDFHEHGVAAIETVRTERPHEYLKVIASLLPKDVNLSHDMTDAFAKIWAAISDGEMAGGMAAQPEQPAPVRDGRSIN